MSAESAALPKAKRAMPTSSGTSAYPSKASTWYSMAAPAMATRDAATIAAIEPSTTGNRESGARVAHSSTDMVIASQSANPLADRKRPALHSAPPSGANATTSTASSATPNIVASRGSRQKSGSQGS